MNSGKIKIYTGCDKALKWRVLYSKIGSDAFPGLDHHDSSFVTLLIYVYRTVKTVTNYVSFTAVLFQVEVFWVVMPCCIVVYHL